MQRDARNYGQIYLLHCGCLSAEVPWRLYEDGEILKNVANGKSPASFTQTELEALEVHSRTNVVEGLFKPVLQFLRKSPSEVVVVVFSAVNGNTHTQRNMVAKGSELAESLAHAEEQLKAFLHSGQPYSDNAHEANSPTTDGASSVVRVGPHSAYHSPWLDSFVKKGVSFKHFAEITELIDTHWGPLLPHHTDTFVDADNKDQSMTDSVADVQSFRVWQRSQGIALLGKPISELLDAKVRLILLVDDPLFAWFITTRSRSSVLALVKADHLYDVSYMSESHSAPCASPHTARTGEPQLRYLGLDSHCRGVRGTSREERGFGSTRLVPYGVASQENLRKVATAAGQLVVVGAR